MIKITSHYALPPVNLTLYRYTNLVNVISFLAQAPCGYSSNAARPSERKSHTTTKPQTKTYTEQVCTEVARHKYTPIHSPPLYSYDEEISSSIYNNGLTTRDIVCIFNVPLLDFVLVLLLNLYFPLYLMRVKWIPLQMDRYSWHRIKFNVFVQLAVNRRIAYKRIARSMLSRLLKPALIMITL